MGVDSWSGMKVTADEVQRHHEAMKLKAQTIMGQISIPAEESRLG